MSRHERRLPVTPRTVRRRPTLPGVQRAQVPLGRLGDPRALPAGLAPPPRFQGGTRRRLGQPASHVPGHVVEGIGAGDPTQGLGVPGPATGGGPSFPSFPSLQGVGATGLFSPATAPGGGSPSGAVTPQSTLFAQRGFGGRSVPAPDRRPEERDRRRPGFSGQLPPIPFQSFDDFFAARRLQTQFGIQEQNPFPFGGGNRFTPEQARIRAAGGDPGESTFIGGPGQPATGQAPGGAGGGVPIQQAGPPTGAFGFGGGFSGGQEPSGAAAGAVGFNAGLLENQAIFAALREALMQRLIPQALGV